MSLSLAFRVFVEEYKDRHVQICLTGGGAMHGRVTLIELGRNDNPDEHVYQIVCVAQLGPNTPPVRMPFTFAGSGVVWYSTGPIADEGPKIATPGSTIFGS